MTLQLDLLKGSRQRGVKPPPPLEFELHCQISDLLQRWCSLQWCWTHFPAGEYRTPATAGRLKRMGVQPGWPDFQFFHNLGPVCFLELKRKGERPTDAQKAVAFRLIKAGHGYAMADNFCDAVEVLRAWRIVTVSVAV